SVVGSTSTNSHRTERTLPRLHAFDAHASNSRMDAARDFEPWLQVHARQGEPHSMKRLRGMRPAARVDVSWEDRPTITFVHGRADVPLGVLRDSLFEGVGHVQL